MCRTLQLGTEKKESCTVNLDMLM